MMNYLDFIWINFYASQRWQRLASQPYFLYTVIPLKIIVQRNFQTCRILKKFIAQTEFLSLDIIVNKFSSEVNEL